MTALSLSSVNDATVYFSNRLYADLWTSLITDTQQAALNDATAIINRFQYVGKKTDPNQINQWPRDHVSLHGMILANNVIPQQILVAQYEIAFALAKGIDPERELRALRVQSRGYSSVRTSYDTTNIPAWTLAGIPSAVAWQLLSAFFDLSASTSVKLNRVD